MSLDLDARQRAMLAEMGIKVWSPVAEPATAAPPAPARTPAPAAAGSGARTPPATTHAPALPTEPRPAGIEHMDWAALQSAVANCRACTLCHSRNHTVFGVGADSAAPDQAPQVDWLIVGEAPGENEDLQGEPFVGAAGQLLDNMLGAMGLSRRRPLEHSTTQAGVYIANVLKCRPPGNRNPHVDEMAQCSAYLQRQIALLRPRIILAMGRFAVQTLLHDSVPHVETVPLGKLRGQVYRYQDTPVVVTYHPAYLLRSLPDKAKAWADLCLALSVTRGPEHTGN